MKRSNFQVPQEIQIEILLLLPFDSIFHCKLVSKQWKNIINDPNFSKRYRDKSLAIFHSDKGNYCCVLLRHGKNKIVGTINGRHHPSFTVHPIHPIDRLKPGRLYTYLSEPSKGIGCTSKEDSGYFSFHNLFTGESYNVPIPDVPLQEQFKMHQWDCCGIGYDSFTDDFKIVIAGKFYVWLDLSPSQENDNDLFWVYSFRNRGWKSFHGFPYAAYDNWRVCRATQSCSLNGVLHWESYLPGKRDKPVILTYDLHTSRFGEISVPPAAHKDFCVVHIAELGGQLCYSVCVLKFYLWAMKEYGVSESWTLLCSIEYSMISHNVFCDLIQPKALYECRDGRKVLLFACRVYGSLYLYYINNSKVKLVHQSTYKKRDLNQPKRKTREVET